MTGSVPKYSHGGVGRDEEGDGPVITQLFPGGGLSICLIHSCLQCELASEGVRKVIPTPSSFDLGSGSSLCLGHM